MSDAYPRWDVIEFLTTEGRICSYLGAAAEDDVGRGDTIRLAWRDIQNACSGRRIPVNIPTDAAGLSRMLRANGVSERAIAKIADALRKTLPFPA